MCEWMGLGCDFPEIRWVLASGINRRRSLTKIPRPCSVSPSLLGKVSRIDHISRILAGRMVRDMRAIQVCCCLAFVGVANSLLDQKYVAWILSLSMIRFGVERVGVCAAMRPCHGEVMF